MSLTTMSLINNTYGSLLLGALVATFLSGMNTLQTVIYFRVYSEDTKRLKALVATVWSLDIIHTGLIWSNLWSYFIIHFGQELEIYVIQKPYFVPGAIIVSTTVGVTVHMYYAHRIFRFSCRNYWITTPVLFLVLCDVASTIGFLVILYKFQYFPEFITSKYTWVLSLGFIFAAAFDIVVIAILFVLLRSSRQRSISLSNTIDQLVLYTLETGSLTAFMVIAITIAWFTAQDTYIFLALYMSLAKVYAAALLGSLNARYHLRHGRGSQPSHDQNMTRVANPLHNSERTNLPTISVQASEASTKIQHQHIHIDVTKSEWIDDGTGATI